MKKKILAYQIGFAALVSVFAMPSTAAVINLQPNPVDLNDLDHYYAYKWNLSTASVRGQTIESVTLSFDNIRNWTTESNILYLRLMDSQSGIVNQVTQYWDNQATGNYFAPSSYYNIGIDIHSYVNLPETPQDLTYAFSTSEIGVLSNYINNDNFGSFALGFDPDCHYFNDGIKLTITTKDAPPPVPEPGTIALLGMGVLVAGFASRRRKA